MTKMRFAPIHYLRVASHFWPWERAFWLALFHDSIEDGWMRRDTLARIGGIDFANEVHMLSRDKNQSYAGYIAFLVVAGGENTIRVKRADLAENYARADASLRRRYVKAMEVLR
jgi:hypothetical protein